MSQLCRRITLSQVQYRELVQARDSSTKPYIRERAAAILKIAGGICAAEVARSGLLRLRQQDTVRDWLNRYEQQGIQGLYIHSGRGRKPAFFPWVQGQHSS